MVTQMPPRLGLGPATLAVLVAGCSLLGALLPVGAIAGPFDPAFGSTHGGTGVPRGPVTCSELVTDTTLTELVSQYYPNDSLLPSENQAEQAVTVVWNDLCGSTTFQQALTSAGGGWFEYASQMQDKNWTDSGLLVGSLFIDFELTWNASCPSGGTGYPAGYGCQFKEAWQTNLTEQSVTGPKVTITSLRLVPCVTPDANETAVRAVGSFFPSPGTAPNQSLAVQEVQAIWGAICTSASYYDLAAPLVFPQALTFSAWRATPGSNSSLGTSDHLYFEWSLVMGDLPCPAENGSSSNGLTCSYWESWTGDLTSDTYSGPSASAFPNLGGPSVGAPQVHGNNLIGSWDPTLLGFFALGSVIVVAVLVGVIDRPRR